MFAIPSYATMSEPAMVVRNISDTARWAAVFRANETLRADALFRDPYASRLAGALGVDIANTLPEGNSYAWAWVARTYLFDQFILREIQQGVDMVVNLAAGLDARPYRMRLAPALQWVEIDLPEILTYKEAILAGEKPTCRLERIRLDLSDVEARKPVFAELAGRAKKIVVLTEGLLIYLEFSQVGAPFKFEPPEGLQFLEPCGSRAVEVKGLLKTAARFKRPPFGLRLLSLLPEKKGPQGSRPWSGVCLFERTDTRQ